MCHRYADCKVTTAGETKLLVASAIAYSSTLRPQPRTWEEFRDTRTSLAKIDAFASSFVWGITDSSSRPSMDSRIAPTSLAAALARDGSSDNEYSTESDSSSPRSSDSEPAELSAEADDVPNWFAIADKTRAHLLAALDPDGQRRSLCRKNPFGAALHSGAGTSTMAAFPGGICDICIRRCSSRLATSLLDAISKSESVPSSSSHRI